VKKLKLKLEQNEPPCPPLKGKKKEAYCGDCDLPDV